MNDRARRADRRRHVAATKSIERFDPEMFAQGEAGVVGQKREIVVGQRACNLAELGVLPLADQNFRRRNPGEIVQERAAVVRLGYSKFAGAQLRVSETKPAFVKINRAEIIWPVRFQQIQLAHRSRGDDLGDLAGNDLSRLWLAGLVADRDPAAGLDELRNVALG